MWKLRLKTAYFWVLKFSLIKWPVESRIHEISSWDIGKILKISRLYYIESKKAPFDVLDRARASFFRRTECRGDISDEWHQACAANGQRKRGSNTFAIKYFTNSVLQTVSLIFYAICNCKWCRWLSTGFCCTIAVSISSVRFIYFQQLIVSVCLWLIFHAIHNSMQ